MDPLSTTGVAIGVTGLTIQLIQGFGTLSTFFQSLKDAPKEVESIQHSLNIISGVLYSIRDKVDDTNHDPSLESALSHCNETLRELSNIVKSLTRNLEGTSTKPTSRTWSSLKTVRSSEKIRGFQTRLDRAKLTMVLAQNSLSM